MRAATGCGCDTYTGWLPLTSTTLEPARLDIHRWASGGIILSSVVTKYQLGFVFHAGSADRSVECLNAPRDLGIRHKSSRVWCHVSGEGSGKLRVIEEQISILWRQNRWHRSTGRRVLYQRGHRLACVGSECSHIDQPDNFRVTACLRDHGPAVRVADKDHWAVQVGNRSLGSCYVPASEMIGF